MSNDRNVTTCSHLNDLSVREYVICPNQGAFPSMATESIFYMHNPCPNYFDGKMVNFVSNIAAPTLVENEDGSPGGVQPV